MPGRFGRKAGALEQRLDRDPEEQDWDSSDEDGPYEVELAVGRYDVRNDEHGLSVTSVVILAGEREVLLDIDKPTDRGGRGEIRASTEVHPPDVTRTVARLVRPLAGRDTR